MKQTKRYISITKKSDKPNTVIYHAMSLTALYHKMHGFLVQSRQLQSASSNQIVV
jgi:hypothetical protein